MTISKELIDRKARDYAEAMEQATPREWSSNGPRLVEAFIAGAEYSQIQTREAVAQALEAVANGFNNTIYKIWNEYGDSGEAQTLAYCRDILKDNAKEIRDEGGPGEEDGPWAPGWKERSGE